MSTHGTGGLFKIERVAETAPDGSNETRYEVIDVIPVDGGVRPHRDFDEGTKSRFKSRHEAEEWIRDKDGRIVD